jgi:DUF4097 and DUF4098 domain-containing protein YvlB
MKPNKIALIAAGCLLVGLLAIGAGFAMTGFNFSNFSMDAGYIEKTYISPTGVSGIVIDDSNMPMEITASKDDKVHVDYFENDKEFYEIIQSKSGTLVITKKTTRKWYDYIFNIRLQSVKLNVAVPADFSGDLSVKNSNGPIAVSNIKAKTIDLSTSNGKITADAVTVSAKFTTASSNGNLLLSKVTASEDIACNTSSGRISLDQVEGGAISLKTSNGGVVLKSVVSNKNILIKSSNGSVDFDSIRFATGLDCHTSNGSIKGTLPGKLADYAITSKTSNGKSNLPEKSGSGMKTVVIETSNGSIDVGFAG